MSRSRFLVSCLAILVAFTLIPACSGSSGDNCEDTNQIVCEDDSRNRVDTCGNRYLIESCQCGCAANGTECEECGQQDDCIQIATCAFVCTDDQCITECRTRGTSAAKTQFDNLMGCLLTVCADDSSCQLEAIHDECSAEYADCSNCTQACSGRACGSDGCGGVCGQCGPGQTCSGGGQCEGTCQPQTCADLGKACGQWDDGCGGRVTCPNCPAGETCNATGQCEAGCTAQTCADLGVVCGQWDDGCGGQVTCPNCPAGEGCNAVGQCEPGCTAQTCVDLGKECGQWDNGCGGQVTCPNCPAGEGCNATGQCEPGCTAQTCSDLGKACGQWDDGCGGQVSCPACPAGQSCDANGQCQPDCQPSSCSDLGRQCGTWDNGCGGQVTCPACPAGQSCDANGQCQPDCQPSSCSDLGRQCGTWDNGCGGQVSCPACPAGQSCDTNGQCQPDCQPSSCADLGKECGTWDNGCGGQVSCPACPAGHSCSANGLCFPDCVPSTCSDLGVVCGQWDDGCGGQVTCPSCGAGFTCVTGACIPDAADMPDLSLDSQNGGTFTLMWTYTWSGLGSTSDHYSLEESTTGPTSGFTEIVETVWNDRTSPWYETLTRTSGTYYYRVRALTWQGWSEYSNVVTVTVALQPATLRIVNDLYDQQAGGNDWPLWNQLFRIWIAGDSNALNNCTDSCDRLSMGTCSLPGGVITPDQSGGSWADFDVSMHTDGDYCVYIDTGWWDYFCGPVGCCWEEHATQVVCCDGVSTCWKWATFCVNGHFSGTFTVNASDWLPIANWAGSPLCP